MPRGYERQQPTWDECSALVCEDYHVGLCADTPVPLLISPLVGSAKARTMPCAARFGAAVRGTYCPPLCAGVLWPMPAWVRRDVRCVLSFSFLLLRRCGLITCPCKRAPAGVADVQASPNSGAQDIRCMYSQQLIVHRTCIRDVCVLRRGVCGGGLLRILTGVCNTARARRRRSLGTCAEPAPEPEAQEPAPRELGPSFN